VIYAIFLGWPTGDATIAALGTASQTNPGKVLNVTLVGSDAKVKWTQGAEALHIELPRQSWAANDYGAAIKIAMS
jgi:alpha-L-fucosidase